MILLIIIIIYGIFTNFIVLFSLSDINSIFFIPLSSTEIPDKIIWHFIKSGKSEVRSGYHLAKDLARCSNATNRPQASFHSFPKPFWNFFGSLKIKNKHKHFLIKCILNVLPVKPVLSERVTYICDARKVCGLETKTIDHMLLKCPKAQVVRKLRPIN